MSTPTRPTPQQTAKEVLRIIGIDVLDSRSVVLTDRDDVGARVFTHLINPGQLVYACEQYRLTTGESIDHGALEQSLPWLTAEDFE